MIVGKKIYPYGGTHIDSGSFVAGVLLHPPARKTRRRVYTMSVTERLIIHVCIVKHGLTNLCNRIFFHLKKCSICIETMAAANFSRDVLEMFFGPILNK